MDNEGEKKRRRRLFIMRLIDSRWKVNLLIVASFVLYILFSNSDSAIRRKTQYTNELEIIEAKIRTLELEMKQDSTILRDLMISDEFLERYAREKLLMCKPNEVIFKIE